MTAPDLEESHYYHTIQYFNALIKQHGVKQVMDDLKLLDLLTYEAIVLQLSENERSKKPIAAIFHGHPTFKPPYKC